MAYRRSVPERPVTKCGTGFQPVVRPVENLSHMDLNGDFQGAADQGRALLGACSRRRAFTLVELSVSVLVLGILAVGMTSAILLSTHALPGKKTPQTRSMEGAAILQQIAADLAFATTIPQRTANTLTFIVHDRGHGPAGSESIHYTWSGTAGSPLTRQYNGNPASIVADDVHLFQLTYIEEAVPLVRAPRVLMIVKDPASLTTDESQRKSLLESWGMTVTAVSWDATEGEIRTAALARDVVFITVGNYKSALFNVINTLTRGVVSEEPTANTAIGVAGGSLNTAQKYISVVKNDHSITSVWALTNVNIITSSDQLHYAQAPLASGANTLGELSVLLLLNGPALIALDDGATNVQGNTSAGRRVKLPWGSGVTVNELTDDGRQLLQRSLSWAAEPHVVSSVHLVIQIGSHPAARVQTAVKLHNQPRKDRT